MIQIIVLFAGGVIVGFLFNEAKIYQESQIKVYFASVCIAASILLIVLDLIVSVLGGMIIKSHGIKAARWLSAAIIFGFIGFKRIRCLQ